MSGGYWRSTFTHRMHRISKLMFGWLYWTKSPVCTNTGCICAWYKKEPVFVHTLYFLEHRTERPLTLLDGGMGREHLLSDGTARLVIISGLLIFAQNCFLFHHFWIFGIFRERKRNNNSGIPSHSREFQGFYPTKPSVTHLKFRKVWEPKLFFWRGLFHGGCSLLGSEVAEHLTPSHPR